MRVCPLLGAHTGRGPEGAAPARPGGSPRKPAISSWFLEQPRRGNEGNDMERGSTMVKPTSSEFDGTWLPTLALALKLGDLDQVI